MCVRDIDLLKTDQFKSVPQKLGRSSACLPQEYEAGTLPKHIIRSYC